MMTIEQSPNSKSGLAKCAYNVDIYDVSIEDMDIESMSAIPLESSPEGPGITTTFSGY